MSISTTVRTPVSLPGQPCPPTTTAVCPPGQVCPSTPAACPPGQVCAPTGGGFQTFMASCESGLGACLANLNRLISGGCTGATCPAASAPLAAQATSLTHNLGALLGHWFAAIFGASKATPAAPTGKGIPASPLVATLKASNFSSRVLQSSKPTLVEFYAPWCPHCQHMAPIVDATASQVNGQVSVGRVDCTTETGLSQQYGINCYPTFIVFKNGQIVGRARGDMTQGQLDSLLKASGA